MVTNDTGAALWSWNSDAFGTSQQNFDVDGDNVNFPFILRFSGQLFDPESNNHYNYYRDYEPGTGRYLESDPIGLDGGMNTFGYVEGNPNTKFDIFGQQTGAGLIALCAGPVRGSICVCGGIVAYLFSSSSGSSSSSSPLLSSRGGRVIPITSAPSFSKPKSCSNNECDDGDNGCKNDQSKLLTDRLRLVYLHDSGFMKQGQWVIAAKNFNARAKTHNIKCPSYKVTLISIFNLI